MKSVLVYLLALILMVPGCSTGDLPMENGGENEGYEDGIQKDRDISLWTVYWDTEDLDERLKALDYNIKNISYFAAYFNENEGAFIPDKTSESFDLARERYPNHGSYLTFVNDIVKADGKSSLKDTQLLYNLFSSEESIEDHVYKILNMTISNGYDGVEIDYEAMKKDMHLWELYIKFLERLYEKAAERDIEMRVVLEPGFPDSLSFPEGPDYVIMCYNLYGHGTEPGPKADKDFLLKMAAKSEKLPGEVSFGIASGGFRFYEGNVQQLTEREAAELAKIHDAHTIRDKDSQALHFSYEEDGMVNNIWYADTQTLNYWFSIVEEYGTLSLWRL